MAQKPDRPIDPGENASEQEVHAYWEKVLHFSHWMAAHPDDLTEKPFHPSDFAQYAHSTPFERQVSANVAAAWHAWIAKHPEDDIPAGEATGEAGGGAGQTGEAPPPANRERQQQRPDGTSARERRPPT